MHKYSAEQIAQIKKLINEYEEAKILTKVSNSRGRSYYNPLVLVWRKSLTTLLCICLDASRKASSGLSANQVQLAGPKLQPDLVVQLLKF
jgi:hypothetical protein